MYDALLTLNDFFRRNPADIQFAAAVPLQDLQDLRISDNGEARASAVIHVLRQPGVHEDSVCCLGEDVVTIAA